MKEPASRPVEPDPPAAPAAVRRGESTRLPPGPPMSAAMQTGMWLRRPTEFLEACWRRYGDMFTLRLWGFDPGRVARLVFVADPALAKDLLTEDPNLMLAGVTRHSMLTTFGPNSVLLLDGEEHLQHRRRILPPFGAERMGAYRQATERLTEEEIARWPLGEPFALAERMRDLTLQVILEAVVGPGSASSPLHTAVRRFIDKVSTSLLAEILFSLPFGPGVPGFEKAMKAIDDAFYAELAARRRQSDIDSREDVLSLLVRTRDPDGRLMSDAELRDEVITLVLAGHETTATSLAWSLEHVLRHPRVRERAVAEARAGAGAGGRYVAALITETLRINPPFPGVARRLAEPAQISGYQLDERTFIVPAIHLIHRRADLYPDPLAFRPERFLERPSQHHVWLPFGRGWRHCPGRSLSLAEMQVILETVLRLTELQLVRSEPEKIRRRGIIMVPGHGTPVIMTSRQPS